MKYLRIYEEFKRKNYYYKVVTKDMKSLGLRKNPNVMTFPINEWIYEPKERLKEGSDDVGGIWVAQGIGGCRKLRTYMMEKYNIPTRIFKVEIGNILYQNSYRVKTDAVKFIQEIEPLNESDKSIY